MFMEWLESFIKFEPLTPKDFITLLLTLVTVTLSLYLFWDKRKKDEEDAKKEFAASLSDLLNTRKEIEDLEYTASQKSGTAAPRGVLRHLHDKREMFVSRLVYLADRFKLKVSSHEFIVLAAALIDGGRIGEAIPFYGRAVDLAANEFERANAQRVYGRALIAFGEAESGRQHMIEAAQIFESLQQNSNFERDHVLTQAAESYRRLIVINLQKSNLKSMEDDFKSMDRLVALFPDVSARERFNRNCASQRNEWATLKPHLTRP
jgi:hypothetical protein